MKLKGEIPVSLGNLSELVKLNLTYNKLSGTLVTVYLYILVTLFKLIVTRLILKGEIPASLGNLSKLVHLDLYDNKLSGTLYILVTIF